MLSLFKVPLAIGLGLLLASTGAHAQAGGGRASGAGGAPSAATRAAVEHQAQQLTQQLGLSADQRGRLRNVLLLTRQHMDADLKANTGNPAALRTSMAYDRAKSEELIQGVLTPAQYTRYQQVKAQRIGQLHMTSQTN